MGGSIATISVQPSLEQRADLSGCEPGRALMHDEPSVQTAKRCLMLYDRWSPSGFRLSLDTGSTAGSNTHCIAQKPQDELSRVGSQKKSVDASAERLIGVICLHSKHPVKSITLDQTYL